MFPLEVYHQVIWPSIAVRPENLRSNLCEYYFRFSIFSYFSGSCSTTYLSSSGTIKSPGWPSKYSNNVVKCWRIDARLTNYVVKLTISSLKLQFCSGCSCDSIEVFDGSSQSFKSLGKFCTGSRLITSSGRYLYVKFTSDSTQTGNAFSAFYTAIPKGKGIWTPSDTEITDFAFVHSKAKGMF